MAYLRGGDAIVEDVRRDDVDFWENCNRRTDSILGCSNDEAGNTETVTLIELGDSIVFTHILNNFYFPIVESHHGS
ncbi:MAG: hypothetical protein P8N94_09205 [Gammaproteobacteria bacterium]|nr:hypothetical protein [Gammaproteobacteria bacterium]MDG2338150.1 hypothetical protein [Gammaproteobacteria bacterium]